MFFRLMLFCSVYINYVGLTLPYPPTHPECGKQDYIVGDLCCPKCPPGKKISEDCKKNRATTCTICTNGTFQEGLNQQRHCVSNCTKCDEGLGLKVKKSCSSTSDAVCEVLDGLFCSDSNRGGCRAAQRHRLRCSPGQYIGQTGAADKDTECLHCTDGTFSDGTSSCQPHTTCDSAGGVQIKPGTDSTDSTCIHYSVIVLIIIGCILPLISIIALGALVYRRRVEKKMEGWLPGGAAGEGTSGYSSTSLLSLELVQPPQSGSPLHLPV